MVARCGESPASGRRRRGAARVSVVAVALACCCAALLCGCWGAVDIEERAVVTAIGIDSSERGVGVSLQVAVNEKMKVEGGGGGRDEAFYVVRHDDAGTAGALHRAQDRVSMPVYLGHLKAVVIGEEFARGRGIMEPLAALMRHPQIRGQVWIAVARGSAEDLLRKRVPAERLTAAYLERLLDTGKRFGHTVDSRLVAVTSKMDSPGYQLLLPILKAEEESVEIENAAVFRGDRLVGELTHEEMHDFALIEGSFTSGVYSIPSPRGVGEMHILVREGRRKVTVTDEGGRVVVGLRIWAHGDVVEDSGDVPGVTRGPGAAGGVVESLERRVGEEIRGRVEGLIRRVQAEYGADVFGFSRHSGRLKLRGGLWESVFPSAEIRVEVDVMLRRFGLGEV